MARLIAITVCLLLPALASWSQESPPYDVAPWPLEGHHPQPEYPDIARTSGTTGVVIVSVTVDASGSVANVSIVREKPEHLGFKEEVSKSVDGWKFSPALKNGKAVESSSQMEFCFGISQQSAEDSTDSLVLKRTREDPRLKKYWLQHDSTSTAHEHNPDGIVAYQPPPVIYVSPRIVGKSSNSSSSSDVYIVRALKPPSPVMRPTPDPKRNSKLR